MFLSVFHYNIEVLGMEKYTWFSGEEFSMYGVKRTAQQQTRVVGYQSPALPSFPGETVKL